MVLPTMFAFVLFAPVASAGPCLYCVNQPFTPVTTYNAAFATGCGNNQNLVLTGQSTGVALVDQKSHACDTSPATGGRYSIDASAGYHALSWTPGVGATVTVTMFWNVSYQISISAPCPNPTFAAAQVEVYLNGSAFDSTAVTSAGSAVTVVNNQIPTACGTPINIIHNTAVAYTVSFSFTATGGHTYIFDTRLDVHTNAYFGPTTSGTTTIDTQGDAGSTGYQGTLSTLEVY